jgi:malate permease and related proteins
VIAIAATIAAALAAGIGAERRYGERAQRASRTVLSAMLFTLVPFIVFFNIARLHVTVDVGGGLALAYVTLFAVGAVAWAVASRVLRLARASTGAVIVSAMQVNTGYLGLPLVAVLLGRHRIGTAAAYDTIVSAPILFGPIFAIGAAFGSSAGEGSRERARAFLTRNPPLLAMIAALLVPDALAPDSLVHLSRLLVFALAPLGFFAVGVNLAAEAEDGAVALPPPLDRPVVAVLGLRLLLAPALLLALATPLIDLPGPYLLQAAMPTGINSLVVAHAYGLDLKIVAGAIAWTTAIVVAVGLVVSLA